MVRSEPEKIAVLGLKDYRIVLYACVIGYSIMVCFSLMSQQYSVESYLLTFLSGNSMIFLILVTGIYAHYPSQIILLAILNVLFYIDKRKEALGLSLLAVVLNVIFTCITIQLGPAYDGIGFTFAFFVVCTLGFSRFTETMNELEYEMMMLR